jgi:hypothetical protein
VRTRTGGAIAVALVLAGFALIFLGGWMYQTSAANAHRDNADCGLNTCATVEASPLGIYLQYVGGFMLLVAAVVAVYVLVTRRGTRRTPLME